MPFHLPVPARKIHLPCMSGASSYSPVNVSPAESTQRHEPLTVDFPPMMRAQATQRAVAFSQGLKVLFGVWMPQLS